MQYVLDTSKVVPTEMSSVSSWFLTMSTHGWNWKKVLLYLVVFMIFSVPRQTCISTTISENGLGLGLGLTEDYGPGLSTDYLMWSGETCFMRNIFLFCTFLLNIRFKCVFDCQLLQSICSNTTPVFLNYIDDNIFIRHFLCQHPGSN